MTNRKRTSHYRAAGCALFFTFYHVKNFFMEISYTFLLRIGIIIILTRSGTVYGIFTKKYCLTVLIRSCQFFRFDISQCEICKSPMQKPVEMPCEHVCCMTCANGWFTDHDACPLCRKKVDANFRPKVSRRYRYKPGFNPLGHLYIMLCCVVLCCVVLCCVVLCCVVLCCVVLCCVVLYYIILYYIILYYIILYYIILYF